jgi:hypothetical protein
MCLSTFSTGCGRFDLLFERFQSELFAKPSHYGPSGWLDLQQLRQLRSGDFQSHGSEIGLTLEGDDKVQCFGQYRGEILVSRTNLDFFMVYERLPKGTGTARFRNLMANGQRKVQSQPRNCHGKVLGLAAAFTGRPDYFCRPMGNDDRRRDFISVLATGAATSCPDDITLFHQLVGPNCGRVLHPFSV